MKESDHRDSAAASRATRPRSLKISEWPAADRQAWEDACRPGLRIKPGGRASYLAQVSRDDFANRYGAYLGFLRRIGRFDECARAASQVTPANVEDYVVELRGRVRSFTVWNCIYKLHRAAKLIDPKANFSWLAEIQKDVALVTVGRSKNDRVVLGEVLLEAGLTLVIEAQSYAKSDFERAKGIRNGLMIAVLALCPIRVKNFAGLDIGQTFKQVHGRWWIILPSKSTKTGSSEERPIPEYLNPAIELYLQRARQVLIGTRPETNALWISSRTGAQFTTKNLGTLISKITRQTIGVDVSPHLFRTAGATTSAIHRPDMPRLASALLGHTDPRVTAEHYIRATSVTAARVYAEMAREYLE